MLKKIKRIIIRDPKLRQLRYNLRLILINYFYDQEAALQALWLGAKNSEKIKLLRELESFRKDFRASICECSICGKSFNDMVFFPKAKEWVCVECVDNDCLVKEYYY